MRGSCAARGRFPAGGWIGFTRDGRFLLVTSGETHSLLLDARTFQPVRTFPVSGAASLSPVEDKAAFGRDDGSVTILISAPASAGR